MGVSVSAKHFKDIVMCTPWGRARILPYGCTILPWLLFLCFCIPSLPWLATAWLNLLIGTQGLLWRLDEAYNQEMGDTEKNLCQESHGIPLSITTEFYLRSSFHFDWNLDSVGRKGNDFSFTLLSSWLKPSVVKTQMNNRKIEIY